MTSYESGEQRLTPPGHRSLVWYLICRTAVITLVLGGAAFFYLYGDLAYSVNPLFFLVGLSYVQAIIVVLILPRLHSVWMLNQVQVVWDLLLVSALILTTGIIDSIFSFFYLLVIISASFLLSRRLTILAAASSVILYGGILLLQFYQLLGPFNVPTAAADAVFLNSLFVHIVAFFLTALLSGTLAERWRRSEALYQRKSIDFAELERMNRTILSHISSGVMLINPHGRIRSFNRAAADITGFTLQQVYDCLAADFFPEISRYFTPDQRPVFRAEGCFTHPAGERLSFGFATTVVRGSRGEELGTLVTFQDLTQLKKIEDQLKRSDRLAAIGRLSAGLAHEIRNPLASISGSAQLLSDNCQLSAEDKQLLGIMVKETDRLNHLLTDFLVFARPHRPLKTHLDVSVLLAELRQMLLRDQRFHGIDVQIKGSPPCVVPFDRSQIWQVLWDLSINAAEAMAGAGTLLITFAHGDPWTLTIEDTGPGVGPEIRERIFEPFFSTKDKGTGLGLSTVYSIIVAHGGTIRAEAADSGGERFVMRFPLETGGEDEQP